MSAVAGAPWLRDAGELDKLAETFSPAFVVRRWLELSVQMWERDPHKREKAWWDYWEPVRTHFFTFVKTAIDTSRSAMEAGSSLMKVFEAFDPKAYLDTIGKLAYLMYHDSGYRSDDFWPYAEKHVLIVSAAAVAGTKKAEEAAAALDETIKSFDWQKHLQHIRERAWWLWKGRDGSFVWDPFQALKDWTEAEKQVRDEISARSIPPKPDERVT